MSRCRPCPASAAEPGSDERQGERSGQESPSHRRVTEHPGRAGHHERAGIAEAREAGGGGQGEGQEAERRDEEREGEEPADEAHASTLRPAVDVSGGFRSERSKPGVERALPVRVCREREHEVARRLGVAARAEGHLRLLRGRALDDPEAPRGRPASPGAPFSMKNVGPALCVVRSTVAITIWVPVARSFEVTNASFASGVT